MNSGLKGEGDVNLSSFRDEWYQNISDSTKEILEEDAKYFLHQSLSTPCMDVCVEAEGSYIYTNDGRKLIDFHGNGLHQVGYKNLSVIEALKRQLDELVFSPRRFTNRPAIELAKKLVDLSGLDRVLFAPGATSSMGMALKLARIATGRFKTISMWDSFHGASLDAISVGGEAVFRKGIGPLLPNCEHVPPPYCYRCVYGQKRESCKLECANYIEYVCEKEGDVGAIVLETVRSTGVIVPPKGYMERVREICDKHGALLILDETPTALGRSGKFFVYEHFGILPDMVVIGKGLGGAVFPFSALIAKESLNVATHTAIGHYTHEKSPLGSAVALATIKYIETNELFKRVAELGARLYELFSAWMQKYDCIGEVRGLGLIWAIELVRDRATKEPNGELAEKIMYECMKNGLSFKVSGGNILTLYPPLTISDEELDTALQIIEKSIQKEMNHASL